jgi:hypothetical protein
VPADRGRRFQDAVAVRIFLSRWADGGALSIAQASNGQLHLLADGKSLATARSLDEIMERTVAVLPEGADSRANWYLVHAPLQGPVHPYEGPERRTAAAAVAVPTPEGIERRRAAPAAYAPVEAAPSDR